MKDPFEKKVRETVRKYSMLARGDTVLIGLSGGADSVSLLKGLAVFFREDLGLALHAIYIDHGLRPNETPGETEFARRICGQHGVGFHTEKIDVLAYAEKERLGKQEAARALRYELLDACASRLGAGKIALGHTADDQVETFFMRLLRGSGPKGLRGIPPVRRTKTKKTIIRPLIETSRSEIEEFLAGSSTGYVQDSSNMKDDYERNRIRHVLLPVLRQFNPNLSETILRTTQVLADEDRYFESTVLKALMRLLRSKTEEEVEVYLVPLESMETALLRRTLRAAIELVKGLRGLDFGHIEEITGLIKSGAPGDSLDLPHGIRAVRKYSTLLITSRPPVRIGAYGLECPGSLTIPETGAVVTADVLYEKADVPENVDGKKMVVLDAEKTGVYLAVRGRRDGDFFHPMGFGGKKKLQDLFVDEKIPRDERGGVPIVVAPGGDIVWVAGLRGDERFKTGPGTKKFLVLKMRSR